MALLIGSAFFIGLPMLCYSFLRLFLLPMEETEAISFVQTLVPFALIVFIIAVGVVLLTQQFRKNLYKQQLEKEALKTQHQRALLRKAIETQEAERKRIAQDLHDELGASLSMGRMQLMQLATNAELLPQRLPFIRELMETALASTRRISHELMPLHLAKHGFEPALLRLANQAEATGQLSVEMDVEDVDALSEELALGIYRSVAELMNNTLKHAQATHVSVRISLAGQKMECKYEDDGKGLPEQPSGNSQTLGQGGLGMKGLEGRVSAMDGTLEYGNRPEGGFFAVMRVPVQG